MPLSGPDAYVSFPPIADIGFRGSILAMRTAGALLLGLALNGAANAEPRPSTHGNSVVFCGGETDVATIDAYFSNLRRALRESGPKNRFNQFVASQFGVRGKRGHTLYFNVKDIGAVTPSRVTVREWKEISRRGRQSLQNAGWRGCFLDNGKVWFEGSKEDGFVLTLISRDMPWAKPERGDALP